MLCICLFFTPLSTILFDGKKNKGQHAIAFVFFSVLLCRVNN